MSEVVVIEEEFCGDCGRSIGYDLRPLALRCVVCQMIHDARAEPQPSDVRSSST
jgi:RNA polymerase-binding transcription factor DksA